jgi:hypothetical protein
MLFACLDGGTGRHWFNGVAEPCYTTRTVRWIMKFVGCVFWVAARLIQYALHSSLEAFETKMEISSGSIILERQVQLEGNGSEE